MRLHKIRGWCFLPLPTHLCGENWRTAAGYWDCLCSRHLLPLPTPCPIFWDRKRAIARGANTLWTKLLPPALTPSSFTLRLMKGGLGKFGRGACRERVWRDVAFLVGAVTVAKKRNH